MSYLINIDEAHREEFLKIIESFKKIGLVKDYQENTSELSEGNALSDDELKNMVNISRQQLQAGEGLTTSEAKEKIKSWHKK